MNANIAVIYAGDPTAVAEAVGEAAGDLVAQVRVLQIASSEGGDDEGAHPRPQLHDLEWADGIACGTPLASGVPAETLMR